jgi:phosphoribosylglycinamide formyltransferase-1
MIKHSIEDSRLARLTQICLALPEATRKDMGQHASFLVRKKTFVYYLDDHHGDGIVSICCKVALGGNADLIASDPARFYLPAYIGHRGWVALRLDLGAVDWDEVGDLVVDSYRLVAPKRLAVLVSADACKSQSKDTKDLEDDKDEKTAVSCP